MVYYGCCKGGLLGLLALMATACGGRAEEGLGSMRADAASPSTVGVAVSIGTRASFGELQWRLTCDDGYTNHGHPGGAPPGLLTGMRTGARCDFEAFSTDGNVNACFGVGRSLSAAPAPIVATNVAMSCTACSGLGCRFVAPYGPRVVTANNIHVCPLVNELTANRVEAYVGQDITLFLEIQPPFDSNGTSSVDGVTKRWISKSGIWKVTEAGAIYTCTKAGFDQLTLTLRDGYLTPDGSACDLVEETVDVNCVAADGGQ